MAARKSTSKRSASTTETGMDSRSNSRSSRSNYEGAFAQWFANPAVRYVASGIATAVLTKIATNIAEKYPQISQLMRDGMDSMEGKLAEFSGGSSEVSSERDSSVAATGSRTRRSSNASLSTH